MKFKLIASVLVLVVALTGVLGATAAYLSDTEQSSTTVSAGKLDLTIGNAGQTAPATLDKFVPGETRTVYALELKNAGNINGYVYWNGVNIISNLENDILEPESEVGDSSSTLGELGQFLSVNAVLYTYNGRGEIADFDSIPAEDLTVIYEETITPEQLMGGYHPPVEMVKLPLLKPGEKCYAKIFITWTPTAYDNFAHGDSVVVNAVFELLQNKKPVA